MNVSSNTKIIIVSMCGLASLVFGFMLASKKANPVPVQAIQSNTADQEITASDLDGYVTGVVYVDCGKWAGSGSLWKMQGQPFVLTNAHVIKGSYSDGTCMIDYYQKDGALGGVYDIPVSSTFKMSSDDIDVALAPLVLDHGSGYESKSLDMSSLNFSVSNLSYCPSPMPVASPVVIIGYPAYAGSRIISNGIISGYNNSTSSIPNIADNPDYFISAKSDAGNSGGIALSKNASGLCLLGIPTWLTVGDYETQGIVQNIRKIRPQ